MKLQDIIINEEYAGAVPPLTDKEYWDLFISIKENGFWKSAPLIINSQRVLLDGHHRYKSCKEQGIEEVETFTIDLPPLQEKLYVINTNRKRRQLSTSQDIKLAFIEAEIENLIKQGQKNIEATYPEKGEKGFQPMLVRNQTSIDHLKVVAKKTGKSRDTVSKVKKIMDSASEELNKKVDSGQTSINYAYIELTRQDRHIETPKLPEGSC